MRWFHPLRSPLPVALVLAAILPSGPATPAPAGAPHVLACPDDTVRYITGGRSRAYPLSKIPSPDTTYVYSDARVWLAGTRDTLEVPFQSAPFVVHLAGPRGTVVEVLCHHPEPRDLKRLALLREKGRFGATAATAPPPFRYSRPDEKPLREMCRRYGLTAVAGTGRDFDRAVRLLHWVHATVRHDGEHPNPAPLNSLDLLGAAARTGATCNCRGLATILNDACLAVGLRSRHLTCLPYDRSDTDCHVVNMVWLEDEARWVYLDPTNDGWFMDAAGRALAPDEIRAALVRGDSLRVPEDLNWNGQPVTREHYINYMTKNMFRFSCPLESRYGYEEDRGPGGGAQVALDPTDYEPVPPGGPPQREGRLTWYHTDIDAAFWAPPPAAATAGRR